MLFWYSGGAFTRLKSFPKDLSLLGFCINLSHQFFNDIKDFAPPLSASSIATIVSAFGGFLLCAPSGLACVEMG